MKKRLWAYISEAGGWGVASNSASFVLYILGLLSASHYGSSVTATVILAASVPLFWVGGFVAWANKAKRVEELEELAPRVYVEAAVDFTIPATVFTLTNHGKRMAQNLQMTLWLVGASSIDFPTIDNIAAGASISINPNLETGCEFTTTMLTILGRIWDAETKKRGEVPDKMEFELWIAYTDSTFKSRLATICALEYFPNKEIQHSRSLASSNAPRVYKDILVVKTIKFDRSPTLSDKQREQMFRTLQPRTYQIKPEELEGVIVQTPEAEKESN